MQASRLSFTTSNILKKKFSNIKNVMGELIPPTQQRVKDLVKNHGSKVIPLLYNKKKDMGNSQR